VAASGSALGFEEFEVSRYLLNKALEIQPTQGRAWVTLGLIDLLDSNLRDAQKNLEKAVKYMPDHIGSWHVLAWAQLLQNNIEAAELSFLSALKIDENFGETHGGLAVIAAMKGKWDQAKELSKIAKRLDPESKSPLYAQILQLQHEGRADVAQRITDSVLKNSSMPNGRSLQEILTKYIKT
ncbi:MAG TPA: hypothetical protein VFS17_01920, partial [Methylophilaceae bacterium]|nr:hypothetical protein [Methylophilaceae bacterium]